jgi:hypothetical protein
MKLLNYLLTKLPSRYSIRQLYIRVCVQREIVKVAQDEVLLQLGIEGKISVHDSIT